MRAVVIPWGHRFPIAICVGLFALLGKTALSQPGEPQAGGYGGLPVSKLKYDKIDKTNPVPGAAIGDRVVSMRKSFPAPIYQGHTTNSCTAVATAYGLRTFLERQKSGWTGQHPSRVFSPAFIYNIFNNGSKKTCVRVQNALSYMIGGGVCTWQTMPYDPDDVTTEPSDEMRQEAFNYTIPGWETLDVKNAEKVRTHLASGVPVVVVAFVDPPDEWAVNARGVTDHYSTDFPKPKKEVEERGNCHTMVVVGYDNNKQAFEVMNSWGSDWQDGGFGWIAYSFWKDWVHEGYIVPKPKPRRVGPPGSSPSSTKLKWLPVGPEGVDNGNWGYSPDVNLKEVQLTEDKKLPPEIKEELAPVITTEAPSATPAPPPITTPSVEPAASPAVTSAATPAASDSAARPTTSPTANPSVAPTTIESNILSDNPSVSPTTSPRPNL